MTACTDHLTPLPPRSRRLAAAFTLMEMVVSVTILVLVILSVGVIFQSAGRSVGVSQASMEMLSNVRAVQRQLESDVAGVDKNGFLVIRSGSYTDTTVTPNITRRCDQISFMAHGSFSNRTGIFSSTNPFTDNNTTVPAAFIWWGQLAFADSSALKSNASPTDPGVPLDASVTTYRLPLEQVPTGLKNATTGQLSESSFALGRCPIMLVPPAEAASPSVSPNGNPIMSYPTFSTTVASIDWNNTQTLTGTSNEGAAAITQSRISAAQGTPSQIMSILMGGLSTAGGRAANPRYEADRFCYRFAALRTPFDGVDSAGNMNPVNGYFRMHPIALQGVSSFIIEWTDGTLYAIGNIDPVTGRTINAGDPLLNTTRWYGLGSPKATSTGVDPSGLGTAAVNGDSYAAVFSYDNRDQWPVALRFRFHVADPGGRLQTGRDFVQVIKLPN
jgi:hypothetical protein